MMSKFFRVILVFATLALAAVIVLEAPTFSSLLPERFNISIPTIVVPRSITQPAESASEELPTVDSLAVESSEPTEEVEVTTEKQ